MEEDWEILELTGPFGAYSVHSPSGGLVYSLGTVIVVWDVVSDKKINLRCHTSPVTSICFSTDNEYFITAEQSSQPLICLWRWRNMEQLSAKWMPFKPRSSPLASLYTSFTHRKVLICEVETDGGYRISIWDCIDNNLQLKLVEELELNEIALGVAILNDQLQFACLETTCLKLWSMDSCTINKRFHFKTPVKAMEYCRGQSVFALLLESKAVLILNQSGKTLSLITNTAYTFTALANSQEYLYLSTAEGSVLIYNLRSYNLFKELPPTHSAPIKSVKVNTGSLIYVMFEDATVQVLNLSEGQVANQSSGHFLPVTSAVWAEKLNFYSSSQEGCLYVWKYVGKGWNMQAMEVSGGKGEISALAVHPSHRVLACGFTKGPIKIFQTGDKPRFISILQFENSCVACLEYSHCGNFLAVLHESGACVVLGPKYEITAELEHSRARPVLLMAMHEVFSSNGMHLMTATCKEEYLVYVQIFKTSKEVLDKTDEKSFEIDGCCTGLVFHSSGNYVICNSNAGGIYIFALDTGDIAGVILTEKSTIGCIVDPSGLYIGTFAESLVGVNNKLLLYEIGTGKKASELGRLDNINPQAVKWSHDGKYLLMGGLNGILTVWRIPKALIVTIHDMLASMQGNPYIWQEYPIDLNIKQLKGVGPAKKTREIIVLPEERRKERGAFVDSVVVLVNKPEKLTRERASSRPTRAKRIEIPESIASKNNSRSDTPVSLHKEYRPTIKHNINDFYFKKPSPATTKVVRKSPMVVKSTLIGTSKSIESIDVECNAPAQNPAHKLYEKFDSFQSDDSEFR